MVPADRARNSYKPYLSGSHNPKPRLYIEFIEVAAMKGEDKWLRSGSQLDWLYRLRSALARRASDQC
jgi:hypothetical protein